MDIDRGALGEGMEKKIVLQGSSEEIDMAKELIEDIVKDRGATDRPPEIK